MEDRHLALRVMLLPKDTNAHGTIFGGVILSHIDLAGAQEARRHMIQPLVTVAMDQVEFHQPVYVGDVVSFYTRLIRIGRTSIQVHVDVEAWRGNASNQTVQVTEAKVVYVAVDEEGNKTPIVSHDATSGTLK